MKISTVIKITLSVLAIIASISTEGKASEDHGKEALASESTSQHNYQRILREIEALTARIHREVDKVLEDYKRDTAEYRRRMEGRGRTTTSKTDTYLITKPHQQQSQVLEMIQKPYEEWNQSITSALIANFDSDLSKTEKEKILEEQDRPVIYEYTDHDQNTTRFLTCLTIGDGDCFTHAAFTEKAENAEQVVEKSSKMRKKLIEDIQNDSIADTLKYFVYGQYVYLLSEDSKHAEVPEQLQNLFSIYEELDVSQISADDVRTYMKRLEIVNGPESYIPLERETEICPAHLLAIQGKKQIRFFELNQTTNKLELIKIVGDKKDPIINILYAGNHYIRLFSHMDEIDQCNQIFQNYLGFTYLGL